MDGKAQKLILSDLHILATMQRTTNALVIDPPISERQLQPASVELRLDQVMTTRGGKQIDLADWPNGYPLRPRQFLLASTIEAVRIPTDLVAQVNGKSTWGRKGLTVHVTAGFIDPGFQGQITLELANLSNESIVLEPGSRICQLVFFQMTSPARRPYGHPELGSHYQYQVGVTPAAG